MQAYRVETTINADGSLTIKHLPLPAGKSVEVIILIQEQQNTTTTRYPLHGKKAVLHNPFDSVAQNEWDVQP